MTAGKREFLTALGTAFLTIGAGCSADTTEEDIMSELTDVEKVKSKGLTGPDATRFIDRGAGVVLYQTTVGGYGAGLTAIPIEDTDLR